jgi:NAD dependent epimerase/dehydratase family enzyme
MRKMMQIDFDDRQAVIRRLLRTEDEAGHADILAPPPAHEADIVTGGLEMMVRYHVRPIPFKVSTTEDILP